MTFFDENYYTLKSPKQKRASVKTTETFKVHCSQKNMAEIATL